jgi:fatty acid desaturase
MSELTEQDLQRRARRRVNQKMGFYIHATVYLLVNLGLAAINFAGGGKAWHMWPLAGWGLGLAIHGFVTFASLNGDGLRERMLDDEVERLRRKQGR